MATDDWRIQIAREELQENVSRQINLQQNSKNLEKNSASPAVLKI